MSFFNVTFLGVGGSVGYNNGDRNRHGCNTLCVAVRAGEKELIFDAGSGICGLGKYGYNSNVKNLFLTHYHIDHIGAMLFWSDLFNPQKKINIYGRSYKGLDVKRVLDGFLCEPYHPAGIEQGNAEFAFYETPRVFELGVESAVDRITVRSLEMRHPNISLGYSVEYDGRKFCYMTDVELAEYDDLSELADFARSADLIVMDSFFGNGENVRGWGHSNWRECAEFAEKVGAKRLALYHYHYNMTDSDIDAAEAAAVKIFAGAFASAEGMSIEL